METYLPILRAFLSWLPIILLCCLPYLIGRLLGSALFGIPKTRIADCQKRCEGLRSKLAKAQQRFREAEGEVSQLADR